MEPLDIDDWRENEEYLYAIDLFNHGYYWEAHEVWEGLWHAHGREGTTAAFLQGLIKLAAAGVKVLQETDPGVTTHATRAAELFEQVQRETGTVRYAGMNLEHLIAFAKSIAGGSPEWEWGVQEKVIPVFDDPLPMTG